MSAGRPIEWTTEKKDKAIDLVLHLISIQGLSLNKIFSDDNLDLPNKSTFYEWVKNDVNLKKIFAKAKLDITYLDAIKCKSNIKGSKATKIDDYRIKNANKVNSIRFPNSSLYIFKIEGTNLYKIGVSNNVDRRFRDLYGATPFVLISIFVKKINNAYYCEEQIHELIKSKYIKNEWFELSKLEIEQVLEKANSFI